MKTALYFLIDWQMKQARPKHGGGVLRLSAVSEPKVAADVGLVGEAVERRAEFCGVIRGIRLMFWEL